MGELARTLKAHDADIARSPVAAESLAGLIALVEKGTISGSMAKDVFEKMFRSGQDAASIVAGEGLTQVADSTALARVIEEVLAQNPKPVEDFKKGKATAKKALVGLVMKATGGKANPAMVNRLLEEKLTAS
jgi:aspartyl-tRNA(Asn)/glutamyl-tRNA(Gln) amidotransferase subunit B